MTMEQPFFATDVYADGMELAASPYTVSVIFTLTIGPDTQRRQAVVRMSLQHAKMMAIQFKRAVKEMEDQLGPIVLPPKLLQDKGVNLEEDW
jgi:hypothetical protein